MKKIKSFRLFESSDDIEYIIKTVKDKLMDLDFSGIVTRVDLVPYLKKEVDDNPEIIVINLSKKAKKVESEYPEFRPSYNWNDIKDVIESTTDYLQSEGFEWQMDQGTMAYGGVPIISTSGSIEYDTVSSKVEMWFVSFGLFG